ncbi:hypothetical protein ACIQNU_27675 [Streptomyces sp. NPDC091292]|uniref:hypothetical protein n=1 Tax=Streptomyces sp. NPDC091292 TaxID=3365991 RepID=UPI00380A6376
MATLVEIFEHAHAQIAKLSDADRETLANASGVILIPSLYARAGLAAIQRRDGIPLLVSEVGLLEAAVTNLESYEGHEAILCAGYELLEIFTNRANRKKKNANPLRYVHGILVFEDEAGGLAAGSTPIK